MDKKQINVRLSSDMLKRIDEKGKRSDVVRKALDFYFSEDKRISNIYGLIDKKLDKVIEDVREIKRFQPVINLNVPDRLLPDKSSNNDVKNVENVKVIKKGFWHKWFKH